MDSRIANSLVEANSPDETIRGGIELETEFIGHGIPVIGDDRSCVGSP